MGSSEAVAVLNSASSTTSASSSANRGRAMWGLRTAMMPADGVCKRSV